MKEKSMVGENPIVYLFRKTWRHSEGNRKNFIAFNIMFLIAGCINLFVSPAIWAKIMDVVQVSGVTKESMKVLAVLLVAELVTYIIFWSIHGPARVIERMNAFKVRLNYRKYLLQGIMTLPMSWHSDHQSGDTIDKVEKGTNALYNFSEDSFEIIYELVNLVGSYILLVYFFPPAAVMIFIMMLVTAWIVLRFDKVLVGQYHELNVMENKVSACVYDAIGNISTVIILRVERLIFQTIVATAEKPLALFGKNNIINETKWFLMSTCCTFMVISVLGAYFYQHMGEEKGVMIGSVYLLYRYLEKVSNVFGRFTCMYSDIVQRKAKVMNAEILTADFGDEKMTNHVLPKDWQRLNIKGLHFSYPRKTEGENKDRKLEDVNIEIKRGEKIAFVGGSGCGKTTLLKVMRGLYDPQELCLTVDDVVIEEGFGGIARAISLAPQHPEMFAKTIRDNITLGEPYDMCLVRHFTDIALITKFIDSLPRGFDSSIKEKGVNLSGGQGQRLALARALLASRDKEIILLDEPTSSLDTPKQKKIHRSIFEEFSDKTIIASVHSLYLLPLFDKIYFFEKGRLLASGTLDELMISCTPFQEAWQAGKLQDK